MISLTRLPVPARTLGVFLASLLGGAVLSGASVGTTVGTVLGGSYSLSQDVYAGYLVYAGTYGGNSESGILAVGDLTSTSGTPVAYSYTLPIDPGSGPIAFLGLDSGGGVAFTANDSVAPGYVGAPWPYSENETQVVTDIQTGNSSGLVSFLRAHSGDFFYSPTTTQATFLAFSNGQSIGAMSLVETAIPEPGGWSLLFSGLVLCFLVAVRDARRIQFRSALSAQRLS